MKAYLVLDFAISDMPAFMAYAAAIPAQMATHGGRYIVQGAAPTPIEGGWAPEHMVILEFPTRQNAEAFLSDPQSQELFKIRHATTLSKLVLVDGP